MKRMTKVEQAYYQNMVNSVFSNICTICAEPAQMHEDYYVPKGQEDNIRYDLVYERIKRMVLPVHKKAHKLWNYKPTFNT